MKPFVLASSGEVHRYRRVKAILLIPILLAAGGAAMRRPDPARDAAALPAAPRPFVFTESEFRDDWPIKLLSLADSKRALPIGTYIVEGRGPAGAQVVLMNGSERILTTPVSADGDWKDAITVTNAGPVALRAEMRRGAVRAGKSKLLTFSFTDGKIEISKSVAISAPLPGQKVKSGAISIEGIAPPGDSVRVYADGTEIGEAEVDTGGRWRLDTRINAPGKRRLRVLDDISGKSGVPVAVTVAP